MIACQTASSGPCSRIPHKADTDGDGRTDYVEYLAGTDPTIPDLAVTLRFKQMSTRYTEEAYSKRPDGTIVTYDRCG